MCMAVVVLVSFWPVCDAAVWQVRQQDMTIRCVPTTRILVADGFHCYWQPRLKNDSALETWLTTHLWTIYVIFSLVACVEIFVSSYIDSLNAGDDEEDFIDWLIP